MKRTPIVRKTELKRTPFKPKAKSNHKWTKMRKSAIDRSSGYCEARWEGCTFRAAHVHHIKRRSQGGGDEVENLLAVCSHCHHMIHTNVAEAVTKGHLFTIKG
ncbi:HNHc domain containing protein [uncultured Caudovirales phage]|uniref:HNHc domain containing protein n=1 Tax=uncultured Caudovirales phage TaxID=2100421 RepID=A0A6J5MCS4_9CAUD|nr:HNHc domain containing protein [uncultured Caudovirales phage]CAB4169546.1 HNHc domain containing protein [uncultured Caudovirales phage]CAB4196051.1 HNHc domain containing protein [uncultured Caudovirales phage]